MTQTWPLEYSAWKGPHEVQTPANVSQEGFSPSQVQDLSSVNIIRFLMSLLVFERVFFAFVSMGQINLSEITNTKPPVELQFALKVCKRWV